jgi:DNA-binding response OmpR family regulator
VSGVSINEICPCCGRNREVAQADVPRVDLNTSRLFVSGKAIRLAPQLADATATLALNVGKPVNAEFLATKIWGVERPPTYKTSSRCISRASRSSFSHSAMTSSRLAVVVTAHSLSHGHPDGYLNK